MRTLINNSIVKNAVKHLFDHGTNHFLPLISEAVLNKVRRLKRRKKLEKPCPPEQLLAARKFLEYGFEQDGLEKLEAFARTPENHKHHKLLRSFANWELALWYSDQSPQKDARKALNYIEAIQYDPFVQRMGLQFSSFYADLLIKNKRIEEARRYLRTLAGQPDAIELQAPLANCETCDEHRRLKIINSLFGGYRLSAIAKVNAAEMLSLDNIAGVKQHVRRGDHLVSIIMPTYNSADRILTSINSLLNQTWANIEIIVVDDGSTDQTVSHLGSIKDSRVRVISLEKNGGCYAARNAGLQVAKGEFVTIHDDDDWSHPQKIEIQVQHLLENPSLMANLSQRISATSDLYFERNKGRPYFLSQNLSSLMFRRTPVLERIGYWDSVRYGADYEYEQRIRAVFGSKSVAKVESGPVSIIRKRPNSLSLAKESSYLGFLRGPRLNYYQSFRFWHSKILKGESPYLSFPLSDRPFFAPAQMLNKNRIVQNYDVILMSDFSMIGGTTSSNKEEILATLRLGLNIALIDTRSFKQGVDRLINPKIQELVEKHKLSILVSGDEANTDLLIVRYPPVLQHINTKLPLINAKSVHIIANQSPYDKRTNDRTLVYDAAKCDQNAQILFKKKPAWFPISNVIRESLVSEPAIMLAKGNWEVLIHSEDWKNDSKQPDLKRKITIGRHSRDGVGKWPAELKDLLEIYPVSDEFNVKILGGATTPLAMLGGKQPSNWEVIPFGAISPKEFLGSIDVFVFFINSKHVEAFGRVIIEAMAAGVPAILSKNFEPVFGSAALYAEPCEVRSVIRRICDDNTEREQLVERGLRFVRNNFGVDHHRKRLSGVVAKALLSPSLHQRNQDAYERTAQPACEAAAKQSGLLHRPVGLVASSAVSARTQAGHEESNRGVPLPAE